MRLLHTILFAVLSIACLAQTTERFEPAFSVTALESMDLHYGPGICSTFSIDKEAGLFMTAAHCVYAEELSINGNPAKIIAVNPLADLAVVKADVHIPALALGPAPEQGSEVKMYGRLSQHGLPYILKVTLVGVLDNGTEYNYQFLFDGKDHARKGMSGGPITNENGQVVSVVDCFFVTGSPLAGKSCGAFYPYVAEMYAVAKELK